MSPHNTNDEQVEKLFMKIDYAATGSIQWNDFCTYMQLEYAEQDRCHAMLKQAAFSLPAARRPPCPGEPTLRICALADHTLVTAQEDGVVSFWSAQLKLRRSRMVFEKTAKKKPKWVLDFTVVTQYNKLLLGTADRDLQLYELCNLEPYCQISALEAVPLRLDYCSTAHDECMVLYGDDQGCVNILLLSSLGELLRTWKKLPKADNIPSICLESAVLSPSVTYIRWKVHEDWVTQLSYYDSIKAVISSSSHELTALVIGCTLGATNVEQQMKEIQEPGKGSKGKTGQLATGSPPRRARGDQTVFRVPKGVKTFAFSKRNNLLVTGGMDRTIRLWNPYMPSQCTGMLRSHTAPIFYLDISEEDAKIISVSTDNTVKIWDAEDQSCLFSACSKASGIGGELSACLYAPAMRSLYVAADALALLYLKLRPLPEPRLVVSHLEPVLCCKFNGVFRQVVSCSEGSVIRVWDFETGKQLFEFVSAHGEAAITCLTFDDSGRRLVTGGRDGCLKIWNYNNGHCLHVLKREGKCEEICDCAYVELNKSRYIVAVGWDRRINVYSDSTEELHRVQKPQPFWQHDITQGHKEDILCVAHCPPSLLATASYDGEIIVWNMSSGCVCCKLHTPRPPDRAEGGAVDTSVSRVVFLRTRMATLESGAATLISNGPQGSVNFWHLLSGAPPPASFTPSRVKSPISSIAVTADDLFLYAADSDGYVYVYSIKDYALGSPEQEPPPYRRKRPHGALCAAVSFRYVRWSHHAHCHAGQSSTRSVSCPQHRFNSQSQQSDLEVIEEDKVLLSSSTDCTVRLWSLGGEYIGTFGQREPWEVSTPASWKHPQVPYEILTDPQSLPLHPALEGEAPAPQATSSEQRPKAQGKPGPKVGADPTAFLYAVRKASVAQKPTVCS
ncbi:cilia- and flagella-associated protein 337-like [Eudromia elegans]